MKGQIIEITYIRKLEQKRQMCHKARRVLKNGKIKYKEKL